MAARDARNMLCDEDGRADRSRRGTTTSVFGSVTIPIGTAADPRRVREAVQGAWAMRQLEQVMCLTIPLMSSSYVLSSHY